MCEEMQRLRVAGWDDVEDEVLLLPGSIGS